MVRVGDVRRAHGREWLVIRPVRGRAGEERTLYVVGDLDGSPRETRARSAVESWSLVVTEPPGGGIRGAKSGRGARAGKRT